MSKEHNWNYLTDIIFDEVKWVRVGESKCTKCAKSDSCDWNPWKHEKENDCLYNETIHKQEDKN